MDSNPSWYKLRKYKIPMELWPAEALDGYNAFMNPQRFSKYRAAHRPKKFFSESKNYGGDRS